MTDLFVPPAAEGLPLAALDSATEGADRLDARARTPQGRNFLAHALVQLARDGWLRPEPGVGFEPVRERETPEPEPAPVVSPPTDRAELRKAAAEALFEHWDVHANDADLADDFDCCADAVLAVLGEPTDRAAVLREAADRLAAKYSDDDPAVEDLREWADDELRRLAVEAHGTGTQRQGICELPHLTIEEEDECERRRLGAGAQQQPDTEAWRCDAGFVFGGRCVKPAGHRDPHVTAPVAQQPAAETCRAFEVDGEVVSVRGSGDFTEQEREFAAEIIRSAKRKYTAEHPEAAEQQAAAADDEETLPPPQGPEYTPCACDHIEPDHDINGRWCSHEGCECALYRPTPPAPLRRSADDCPGFPEHCPNLRPVDPNPPVHYGGIRCGCADKEA